MDSLLDFCLRASILGTLNLWGRLGISPRKWSINRFRRWGGVIGFEEGGVGDIIQNQTFRFQISRGWHLSNL